MNFNFSPSEELVTQQFSPLELLFGEQDQAAEDFGPIFEKAADAMALLDGLKFVACNEAMVKMMRCRNKAQLLALNPVLLSPERQADGRLSGAKASEIIGQAYQSSSIRFEWLHRRLDGEDFFVEVTMSNVPMHGKPILFIVLRDITERKNAEIAIQRQNAFLDALHGTTLALIYHLDSADLLKNIIERAGQLLNTNHGYLCLVDQAENVLEIKITIGVFQEYLGAKLRPGEGLAGRVWQACCPMSVGRYEEWAERSAQINLSALGNLAAAPLTSGDTVIGVLGMAYPELDHDFNPETLETLNRFAQLVSVVLENARLHTAAQQELAERKRVETERIKLQEEIIQMQEKALVEMSTPLIPLSASVVVMPLIGTIDSRRSLQIKEALLQGIKQHKAKIALLDITGVPLVDEKVADTLVAIAQMARLLGTQVVLTGIRPDVAMKFVQLGASLQGIITQNTLQSGISWALQQQTKPSMSSFSSNSRNRSFVR